MSPLNILVFAPPTPDRTDIIAALPSPDDQASVADSAAQASARLAQGGIDLVVLDLAAGDALRFLRKQPCLTMRENTERPVTVTLGTNQLIERDTELLKSETRAILSGRVKKGVIPPLWDGHAADRIAEHIATL